MEADANPTKIDVEIMEKRKKKKKKVGKGENMKTSYGD